MAFQMRSRKAKRAAAKGEAAACGSCSPMKGRVSAGSTGHGRAGPRSASAPPESPPSSFANTSIFRRGLSEGRDLRLYLIMPRSTACFQVFLNALSRKFARQDILLVLDGAPNHRCSASRFQQFAALPAAILTRAKPEGKSLEGNPPKNLRITPLSQSTLCAPNSSRRSSTSNAIQKSSNPSPHSPTSESHSDVEMVLASVAESLRLSAFNSLGSPFSSISSPSRVLALFRVHHAQRFRESMRLPNESRHARILSILPAHLIGVGFGSFRLFPFSIFPVRPHQRGVLHQLVSNHFQSI